MTSPDLQPQIQRMLDGEITPGELAALERELLENEESREVYRRLAWLHSDLELTYGGQATVAKVVPVELIIVRQRKRMVKVAMYAAAAIVMISVVLLSLSQIPEKPIAAFRTTPGSDFTLTHDRAYEDTPQGQILITGSKLHLRKGSLEGVFESGTRMVIEAPCELRVIAKDRVALDRGTAWFEVPQEAIGFTVETTGLTVVDLGTEFGVESSPTGRDEVHVILGAVQVTARVKGGETQTLREGEAIRAVDRGQLETIEIDAKRFATTLPAANGLIAHWEFEDSGNARLISDSSGNGHGGRLQGGAGIVADPVRGRVLSLSGIDSSGDMVDIDSIKNIPNLHPHRGLTLAAWIKLPADGTTDKLYAYVIGLGEEGDHPIATLGIFNGVVNSFIEGLGQVQVTGDTPVRHGAWTHIAVTFDRMEDRAITYVDGVAQASAKDISTVGDDELDWNFGTIGRTLGSRHRQHFGGLVDDVRIYDRSLSAKEITDLAK